MAHYSKPQDKPSISLANSHEDGYPAIRDGPSQAGFAHLLAGLFVVSSGIPWDFGGHKRCNGNTAQVDNPRDRSTSL